MRYEIGTCQLCGTALRGWPRSGNYCVAPACQARLAELNADAAASLAARASRPTYADDLDPSGLGRKYDR